MFTEGVYWPKPEESLLVVKLILRHIVHVGLD